MNYTINGQVVTPYSIGYKASAEGRDRCPYPGHTANAESWWEGHTDYTTGRQRAGREAKTEAKETVTP